MIRLNRELCVQCGSCADACAFGALRLTDGYPEIGEACVACNQCVEACPAGALTADEVRVSEDLGAYHGFWVVGLEDDLEKMSKVSLELLSAARRLADRRGTRVTLAVFGEDASAQWRAAAHRVGCDEILCVSGAGDYYGAERYAARLAEAIKARKPEVVLFPATANGRDFAPRVACRLRTGLTADCTGLDLNDEGKLMQIRPTYGGNIMATILTPERRPQMASIRPNVMRIEPLEREGEVEVSHFAGREDAKFSAARRIASEPCVSAFGNLDEASVIIAGGYGLGSKENFEKIYRLCGKLNASAAATRKVVDEGWAPVEIQVGQTGKTVAPDLYIALGVSGALQHTLGIKNAKRIIAVNNDPAAPIFSISDVALLADAGDVLDALLEEF